MRGERLDHLEVVGVAPIPAADRPAGQAQLGMGDDPGGIEERAHPEPVAVLARAGGAVEREEPRFQIRDRVAADVAGEAGGEHGVAAGGPVVAAGPVAAAGPATAAVAAAAASPVLTVGVVHRGDDGAALGERESGLERFGKAQRQVLPNPEAIDHHLDRMLPLRIERGRLVQFVQHAVDPGPHEPLRPQALDDPRVLALALADDRGEQHEALTVRARHDRIHHLGDGLGFEHHPVLRAARLPDTGEEQPQVVVDLGDGADGGARVVRGRFLLDRDRGRQPLDMLDVRLLHHREELARVGRKRFDVAPLPLGVDGVERERRLARSREPGDHHQPVAGDVDVDAFQVVRPGATDADEVHVSTAATKGVQLAKHVNERFQLESTVLPLHALARNVYESACPSAGGSGPMTSTRSSATTRSHAGLHGGWRIRSWRAELRTWERARMSTKASNHNLKAAAASLTQTSPASSPAPCPPARA